MGQNNQNQAAAPDLAARLSACMGALLSAPVTDADMLELIARMGVSADAADNITAMCAALIDKVVKKGDVSALREIARLIDTGGGQDSEFSRIEAYAAALTDGEPDCFCNEETP